MMSPISKFQFHPPLIRLTPVSATIKYLTSLTSNHQQNRHRRGFRGPTNILRENLPDQKFLVKLLIISKLFTN